MVTLTPFEQEFFLMLAPTPLQDPYVLQKAVMGKQEKKVYRPRRKKVIEMERARRKRDGERKVNKESGGLVGSYNSKRTVESEEEQIDSGEFSGNEGVEVFGYVAETVDIDFSEVRMDEMVCADVAQVSVDVVSEDVVASMPPWIANLGLI
jgi:hypothetical protein